MIALGPAFAFAFSDALLVITFNCSRSINATKVSVTIASVTTFMPPLR